MSTRPISICPVSGDRWPDETGILGTQGHDTIDRTPHGFRICEERVYSGLAIRLWLGICRYEQHGWSTRNRARGRGWYSIEIDRNTDPFVQASRFDPCRAADRVCHAAGSPRGEILATDARRDCRK